MTAVPLLSLLAAPLGIWLAVVGGTRAWARPALLLALAVSVIAVPLKSGGEEAELAHLRLPDVASALLVGCVGCKMLFGVPEASDARKIGSWVVLPLLFVVLAGGVAAVFADDPVAGVAGWVRLCQVFVVVPLCVFLALKDRRDLWLVVGAVLVLGVLEGGVGVYQYLTGTGAEYGGSTRAVGTFGAYEIMGMATVVTYAIIAAASLWLSAPTRFLRITGLVLSLFFVAPLLFSLSRGAWIAAALGLLVVGVLGASLRRLLLCALAVVLSVGGYAAIDASGAASETVVERASSITGSVGGGADQSVGDRYALWEASRSMLEERPATGVGPKNFALHRDEHAPLSFSGGSDIADQAGGYRRVELLTPHSLYWLILAEQGLLGGLAYGVFFVSLTGAALWRVLSRWAGAGGVERVFALSCLGWIAAFLMRNVYGDLGGGTMVLDSLTLGGLLWLAAGSSARNGKGKGREGSGRTDTVCAVRPPEEQKTDTRKEVVV